MSACGQPSSQSAMTSSPSSDDVATMKNLGCLVKYSDRWVSLKLIQFWQLRNSEGMLGNQEMTNVPIPLPGRKVFKIDGRLLAVACWPCQETVDACPSISRPSHPPNPWSRGDGRWDHGHSQKQKSYKEYNETKVAKIRVEICRDRHDSQSCKICASCVNFPKKHHDFSHNLPRTKRFTHTKCDFARKLLKF